MKPLRGKSVHDIGQAFFAGEKAYNGRNLESVKSGNKMYLVGYGHAIYGEKNLKTGRVTYYSGWDGYSRTTSKHLSQSGIRGTHDREVKSRMSVE